MIRPTLETYIAESGQWAGIVRQDGEEIARIAGCETLDDVLAFPVASGLPFGQLAGFGFLDLLTLFCL